MRSQKYLKHFAKSHGEFLDLFIDLDIHDLSDAIALSIN